MNSNWLSSIFQNLNLSSDNIVFRFCDEKFLDVFSKDQAWANYEAIQADIFDHLLAAAPEFGLRIFQNPSGYDLRCLAQIEAMA